MTPETVSLNNFTNNVLTSVAGENVYNGGGAPIAKIINDTSTTMKIKFKTNSGSGTVNYQISDKQFINGSFNPSAKVKISGSTDVNDEISTKNDFEKDDIVYLNCYSTVDNVEATIDTFNIT